MLPLTAQRAENTDTLHGKGNLYAPDMPARMISSTVPALRTRATVRTAGARPLAATLSRPGSAAGGGGGRRACRRAQGEPPDTAGVGTRTYRRDRAALAGRPRPAHAQRDTEKQRPRKMEAASSCARRGRQRPAAGLPRLALAQAHSNTSGHKLERRAVSRTFPITPRRAGHTALAWSCPGNPHSREGQLRHILTSLCGESVSILQTLQSSGPGKPGVRRVLSGPQPSVPYGKHSAGA